MPVTMVIDPSKTHTPKRTELASPIVKPVQLARKNKLKDLANRYNDDNDGIDDLFNVPAPVEKEEKMDIDDNNNDKEVIERPPEPTKRKSLHQSQVVPPKRQSLDTNQQKISTSTPKNETKKTMINVENKSVKLMSSNNTSFQDNVSISSSNKASTSTEEEGSFHDSDLDSESVNQSVQSANNANSDDENEISDLNDPDYYCDDHPSKDEGESTSEQDTYDGGDESTSHATFNVGSDVNESTETSHSFQFSDQQDSLHTSMLDHDAPMTAPVRSGGSFFSDETPKSPTDVEESSLNISAVIDKLYDFEDSSMNTSVISNTSGITRNKSKKQITNELSYRKVTSNEAECTSTIKRSRKSQEFKKSNSTENLLSLSNQQPLSLSNKQPVNTPNLKLAKPNKHTINSYRSSAKKNMTPLKNVFPKETKKEARSSSSTDAVKSPKTYKLQTQKPFSEVMKQLKDDQKMQMTRIKQLSDALNVCYDVKHGKGSVAEAEAEKLLLIATKKNQALREEIRRMEVEGRMKSECSASMHIKKISLPMKPEHLFTVAKQHLKQQQYYVMLVKTGRGKVLATSLHTLKHLGEHQQGDNLEFEDNFHIENLKSDFEIVLEVYLYVSFW